MNKLLNLILFQGVWFAAVIGAADNNNWYGTIGLLVFLAAIHFQSGTARADYLLAAIATLTGLLIETIFLQAGLLVYHANDIWGNIAPVWILVLWANFALTMNGCLSWLQGRYLLAAALGALGGPISYFGGIKLGAADAEIALPAVLLAVAAVYAVVTPAFLLAAHRLSAKITPANP